MGEEFKCDRCGLIDDSVIDLDLGVSCHRELIHCITALREENTGLKSEVKRYREALEKICKEVVTHYPNVSNSKNETTQIRRRLLSWNECIEVASSALSEGKLGGALDNINKNHGDSLKRLAEGGSE